ncbi:MAG: GNAT family N-acetyltransferase [Chitinophagaceae bacterium]
MYSLKIEPATIADIPLLNKLVNSAYRGESSKKGWTTEADLLDGIRTDEEGLKKMLSKENAIVLLAKHEQAIVGCVYLEKQLNRLYLGMLTVSPELQGAGIGKRLLEAADDYALKEKLTAISMTVITVRKELIAWYERHGYKKTGETKPFPNDPAFGIPKQPLEFLVMRKTVEKSV